MKVSFNPAGTLLSSDYPCVKTEYFFDPKFSLSTVIQSLQNEKHRRRWDPFVQTSKVISTSQSQRLQVVYTQWESFLDQAPRHLFEKKLHFSIVKGDRNYQENGMSKFKKGASKRTDSDNENETFYTYVSSCQVPPSVPGKKSFLDFSTSLDNSSQTLESVEAKTIFSMFKFELSSNEQEIDKSLKRSKVEKVFVSPRFSA